MALPVFGKGFLSLFGVGARLARPELRANVRQRALIFYGINVKAVLIFPHTESGLTYEAYEEE